MAALAPGAEAPVDVAGQRRVVALGEAKWGTVLGTDHLNRLARARDVLAERGHDTGRCLLLCFGAAGFSPALRSRAAEDTAVRLIDLTALYRGDQTG